MRFNMSDNPKPGMSLVGIGVSDYSLALSSGHAMRSLVVRLGLGMIY